MKEGIMTLVARLKEEKRLVTEDAYKQGKTQLDRDLVDMPYVKIKKLIARDFSTALLRTGLERLFWQVKSLVNPGSKGPSWPNISEEIEPDNFVKGYLDRLEERWNTELKEEVEGKKFSRSKPYPKKGPDDYSEQPARPNHNYPTEASTSWLNAHAFSFRAGLASNVCLLRDPQHGTVPE